MAELTTHTAASLEDHWRRIPGRRSALLTQYLDRFDELAQHGICPGPRYRIHYSVLGHGPALYIVTGICTPRRMFALLAVELSAYFRVVLYDLPGITPRDHADLMRYRIEDYPRDLLHLADHLADERFYLMGHSFGTSVATRALEQQPNRIARGMLVGGFAHRRLSWAERTILRLFRHWPGQTGSVPGMRRISEYNHGRELNLRDPALMPFYLDLSLSVPVRTTAMQVLHVDQTDTRHLLSSIHQPIMVVHGNEDRLVTPRHAAEVARLLSNVRIMLLPSCGHMPHLSHPELLAHAARQFLLENEAAMPA